MKDIKLEALDAVSAADANYEKKAEGLSSREETVLHRETLVEKREMDVKKLRKGIQAEIEISATQKIQGTITELQKQFKEKENHLKNQYECMKTGYKSIFLGVLVYGIVITIFEVMKSEKFRSEVVEFFVTAGQCIINTVLVLWRIGSYVAEIGDRIPQPIIAVIVYWVMQIVVTGSMVTVISLLILKAGNRLKKYIWQKMMDEVSATVLLGAMASFIFFAEPIRAFVPINLMVCYLLIILAYFVIRSLIEMEDAEARKVFMVNLGCGLFIIFALLIGFKMMVYGLR